MSKPVTIYALCDDDNVRYIGATSNPRSRLSEHMCHAGRRRAKVSQWLGTLKAAGQRPSFRVLEIATFDNWEEREIHWIAVYAGEHLLNQTLGGAGTPGLALSAEAKEAIGQRAKEVHTGLRRSPETRDRMRAAQLRLVAELAAQGRKKTHKPLSEESRKKMADAMRGKKHTEASKQKMSEQRQDPSPELRAKWAEAARRRDPEWKAWFAQQQAGKPKSEETKQKMSEAAKARWAKKKTACAQE